jgi:hypothetical protein
MGQRQLPRIVRAVNALGFSLCHRQRGQEQGRQDGNDGDDDQQFNQGETMNAKQARTG